MSKKLLVDVFDVGQGDATLVTFPNGKRMLIDMGSTKNKNVTKPDLFGYLEKHGGFNPQSGSRIDYLVLTHADADHYNMIQDFVNYFNIHVYNVLVGGSRDDYTIRVGSGQYINLIGWLEKEMTDRGITLNVVDGECRTPQALGKGLKMAKLFPKGPSVPISVDEFGAEVNVLSMGYSIDDKNTQSVVLQICYPAFPYPEELQNRILLTGDATRKTELLIMAAFGLHRVRDLRSNILKLGHHGSWSTSNSPAWLKAVDPEFVFVSSDRHGEASGSTQTGYRLPDTIVFDLAWKNSPRLRESEVATHRYVSYFNFKDYKQIKLQPTIVEPQLPAGQLPDDGAWWQHNDERAFFTTLAVIGNGQKDPDYGAQYRFILESDGSMNLLAVDPDPNNSASGPGSGPDTRTYKSQKRKKIKPKK